MDLLAYIAQILIMTRLLRPEQRIFNTNFLIANFLAYAVGPQIGSSIYDLNSLDNGFNSFNPFFSNHVFYHFIKMSKSLLSVFKCLIYTFGIFSLRFVIQFELHLCHLNVRSSWCHWNIGVCECVWLCRQKNSVMIAWSFVFQMHNSILKSSTWLQIELNVQNID